MNRLKSFQLFESTNNDTLLVSAFPGCGKSHFFKTKNTPSYTILDSDSSTFDKSDFPDNYIKHIKSNIGKADVIMISSHKDVRDALLKEDMKFTLVYPNRYLKDEYISRYKKRGSNQKFIELLDKNWDVWISELEEQKGCKHIQLLEGQYLDDVL